MRSVILSLCVLALCPAALAQDVQWPETKAPRPYIFTQQNNIQDRPDITDRIQKVRIGYPLQVQLPGNPAVWSFDAEASALVEPRGRAMVYSPFRIEGTQSIFVFDFALSQAAVDGDKGRITLFTDDLPLSLKNVIPSGVYTVEFTVFDPG